VSARSSNATGRAEAPAWPVSGGPVLVGIVNLTADSFSDGGRFLDPDAAITQARRLVADGAAVIELGAAASNVAARPVGAEEEIRRLDPVIAALAADGIAVSIDSFEPEVQRYAHGRGVAFVNDIHGFPQPALYPALAASKCRLVLMHSVQERGRARRENVMPDEVWGRIRSFFAARIAALTAAEIARERLILDPGMGFFLSSRPEASLRVLAGLGQLKAEFGLPLLISVSRKSFLGTLTGRQNPVELGAATLAAELFAAAQGADYIRTHDPGALRDALRVTAALAAETARLDAISG
jgi:dihydropteroate synthase type 2